MNAAAVAAADFKNGFGSQFMQPFGDTDSLYSSYSPYNNWATKVPSPLGATKSFPWPVVNPLGSVVSTQHHHQNTVNCFNTTSSSVTVSMNSTAGMLPGGMGSGLVGGGGVSAVGGGNMGGGSGIGGLNGLGGSLGGPNVSAAQSVGSGPPCPYTTPTNPYTMYHTHRAATEAVPPCTAMTSSIATLRLKAKQHSASGFASPYSVSPSPVSRSNSAGLSACQYAGVTDSV